VVARRHSPALLVPLLTSLGGAGCGHHPPPRPALPDPVPRLSSPRGRVPAAGHADEGCRETLRRWQVPAVAAGRVRGVRTPVEIVGPIDGVRLIPRAGRAPLMDCRLARALAEATPLFHELGVTALSFSGAYDYRLRRGSHRLSAHAHGMAIDVHAFETDLGEVDVARDFPVEPARWRAAEHRPELITACIGDVTRPAGRFLRTLACRLGAHPAFRYVLTPDENSDHWNHFHIEAQPDAPPEGWGNVSLRGGVGAGPFTSGRRAAGDRSGPRRAAGDRSAPGTRRSARGGGDPPGPT
jgi:hypothetical protein